MKTVRNTVLLLWCLLYSACMSGCVETTVTDRYTDAKGHVVERETKTKATDPNAWRMGELVVTAYAPPRARLIQEKAAKCDPRKILTGPIRRQEIALRWKPAQ